MKLSWFPFDVGDWKSGETREFSLELRGAYFELLCHQWETGRINPAKVFNVLGVTPAKAASLWAELQCKFSRGDDGMYRNLRLEKTRGEQEKRAGQARAAAVARWGANEQVSGTLPGICSSDAQAVPAPHPSGMTDKDKELEKEKNKPLEVAFAEFWNAYPRKAGKGAALKAWKQIEPDTALVKQILAAVHAQRGSRQWLKDNGQFIPYPATWLNQQRWQDEISPATRNVGLQTPDCPAPY